MIKSIKHKGLARFAKDGNAKGLSVPNTKRIAYILDMLNAATKPGDMFLPGLRCHPLGKMAPGRWAVEASGNWRITFAWDGEDVVDVDLEDYH